MKQTPRKLLLICLTILSLTGYAVVIGATHPGGVLLRIVGDARISQETARYFERFGASALFLGIIPLIAAFLLGIPREALGIRRPERYGSPRWIVLFLSIGAIIGGLGMLDSSLVRFYPYHPGLRALVSRYGIWVFFVHGLFYVLLYYLPWELTFRGVMVVTVTEPTGGRRNAIPSIFFYAAVLQAAPSAILHFHHPVSEIFGAVIFGFAAGYMALVSRSILPPILVHATAGVVLDGLILLKGGA